MEITSIRTSPNSHSNETTPCGSPTKQFQEETDWTKDQIIEAYAKRENNIQYSLNHLRAFLSLLRLGNGIVTLGNLITTICLIYPNLIKPKEKKTPLFVFLTSFFGGDPEELEDCRAFILSIHAEERFTRLCCGDGLENSLKFLNEIVGCPDFFWEKDERKVLKKLKVNECCLYFKEDVAKTGKMRLMKCVEQNGEKKERLTADVVYLPACGNSSEGRWALEAPLGTACFLTLKELVEAVNKEHSFFCYCSKEGGFLQASSKV